MAGTSRMTISAPGKLLREFGWLCHRRGKSASCVLREFMAEFVDVRSAELEAIDAWPRALKLYGDESLEAGEVVKVIPCIKAAASRTRGSES